MNLPVEYVDIQKRTVRLSWPRHFASVSHWDRQVARNAGKDAAPFGQDIMAEEICYVYSRFNAFSTR